VSIAAVCSSHFSRPRGSVRIFGSGIRQSVCRYRHVLVPDSTAPDSFNATPACLARRVRIAQCLALEGSPRSPSCVNKPGSGKETPSRIFSRHHTVSLKSKSAGAAAKSKWRDDCGKAHLKLHPLYFFIRQIESPQIVIIAGSQPRIGGQRPYVTAARRSEIYLDAQTEKKVRALKSAKAKNCFVIKSRVLSKIRQEMLGSAKVKISSFHSLL
jgi:hypothetical protein